MTKGMGMQGENNEAQEETQKSDLAKVDIVTGEKKMTLSAPVKEFEDLKISFKYMMAAFANFIEAAGLEIGKDDASAQIDAIKTEFQQLKNDVKAQEDKIREELVSHNEFYELKVITEQRAAQASVDYVTRTEFERFREAIREVI